MWAARRRDNKADAPFSYCEPVTATTMSPEHIRPITDAGMRMGGGADTLALCGREVSWDIRLVPTEDDVIALSETFINDARLVCRACARALVTMREDA